MNIKITNFGQSNIYPNNEILKTVCGSPYYTAPEIIAVNGIDGLMIDIWSSGVILFAMLCGYIPFENNET